jgi:hypothetical protein
VERGLGRSERKSEGEEERLLGAAPRSREKGCELQQGCNVGCDTEQDQDINCGRPVERGEGKKDDEGGRGIDRVPA